MSDVISQDPITPQSSWFHRAYNNELDINFHKWWKRGAMVSMVLVLIFGASLLVRGLNLGIEFEGGLVWEVEADLGAGEVRDAMADIGFGDAIIQTGDGTVQVRAEVAADHATVGAEVARALAELAGTSADNVSFNDISASWGRNSVGGLSDCYFFLPVVPYRMAHGCRRVGRAGARHLNYRRRVLPFPVRSHLRNSYCLPDYSWLFVVRHLGGI